VIWPGQSVFLAAENEIATKSVPDNRRMGMTEPDTKELDALLGSLNTSAERFQTLWFSFLGLTLYLAIAALATTHRNLLLGEPQTLTSRSSCCPSMSLRRFSTSSFISMC
jgi:hypothetical protein